MKHLPISVVFLAAALSAQATYTQLTPANSPSARSGLHAVSDGTGVLLFGGVTAAGSPPPLSNELWRFDGTNWSMYTPAVSPPARDWYASCYDLARGRYVLFGGRGVSGTTTPDLGDTWEFDGTNWIQMNPASSPAPRRWAAMMYEPTSGRCILYGGSSNGTSYFGDTWAWDGTNWTQLTPATSPSARGRGWLEWDMLRNRGLFYGGRNTAGALAETWLWDGTTWTLLPTTTQPGFSGGPGLFTYGMTYDLLRDRMVIAGGTRTGATSNQTWEFDGTDWRLHNTAPWAGRTGTGLVFVIGLGKSYLFGGFTSATWGDTWEYQTDDWATTTVFGNGCAGPAGVPSMVETSAAWLGEVHSTQVVNLHPSAQVIAVLGLSNTVWSGGALPFPLLNVYPRTMPGCQLLVSMDIDVWLPNVGGTAVLSVPVPNDPLLIGMTVHKQFGQLDTAMNLSVTAGASTTIGAK